MKIYISKTNAFLSRLTADIVKGYKGGIDDKCVIFCEDKNTLNLESEIVSRVTGSFNITVSSFSRYVSKFERKNVLSKTGSALIMRRILTLNSDKLVRLRLTNQPTLALSVFELISQLKSAKISPETVKEIYQKEDGAFKSKLKDVYLVYAEYEKYLRDNNLIDSGNYLSLMPKLIENDLSLKGAKIIFSGFSSITKQSIDIFQSAAKVSDVDFVLIKGDAAFYTNEVFNKVTNLFPSAEIIEDTAVLNQTAQAIYKTLYNPSTYNLTEKHSGEIKIIEAANVYREAENTAKRIRYEVVNNGKRFRDFTIATGDATSYGRIFSEVFSEYEIPLFVDNNKTMEKHPSLLVAVDALDAVRLNYSVESMLSLSRSELLFSQSEAECFERFVYKNAISRRTMVKSFNCENLFDQTAEAVRLRLINTLSGLSLCKTAGDYTKAIRNIFLSSEIKENSEKLSNELNKLGETLIADFNEKGLIKFNTVLDEIETLIGGETVNINEFKSLILSAAAATEIPLLPEYNDNVYMGIFKNAGRRQANTLFAVGLDATIPLLKQDTAFFCDKDLIKMEGYKLIVEPKIKIVNLRERESLAISLISFTDKLFLSYPLIDMLGKPSTKSEIIAYFEEAFNINSVNSDTAKRVGIYSHNDDYYKYMTKDSGIKNFALDLDKFCENEIPSLATAAAFYENSVELGGYSLSTLNRILNKDDDLFILKEKYILKKFSASVLESYFSCPYQAFANNVLKLKEDENGEVQANEFGNMLHEIFENFIPSINTVKDKISSDVLCLRLFDEQMKKPDYSRYLNKPEYKNIFEIVKKEALNKCYDIYNEFKTSLFKPIGEEILFGDYPNATFPAIHLNTPYGDKIITGKIDRVDRYNNYARIIDYKTGYVTDSLDLNELYYGKKLQLFLYANAINKYSLAGAYYYKVRGEYKSESDSRNIFVGATLLSDEIAMATDTEIQHKNSNAAFNIKYKNDKKKGRVLSENKATIDSSTLNAYVKYAKSVAEIGASEMLEGNIVPSPVKKGNKDSCEYCSFKGMCFYDAEVDNKTRNSAGANSSIIAEAVGVSLPQKINKSSNEGDDNNA